MSAHIWRAFACACCFASPALAATPQNELDAVIVTATRFPDDALSAPIGTRVITAAQIADSTATTLPELLAQLGGLNVRDGGAANPQIDLRGFGVTGDDNTLVLIDGVRMEKPDLSARPLNGIPLSSIERIEILPGGGAVQYGAGATAGTINIITRKPAAQSKAFRVSAGAGSFDARKYAASGTFSGEEWGLTLNGLDYRSDNYRDNNDVQQSSGSAVLQWRKDFNRLALRIGADRQASGLPSERTELQLHTDPRGTRSPDDRSSIDTRFTTLSGGTRLGPVELELDLNHRHGENEARYVSSASAYETTSDTYSASPRLRWSTAVFNRPTKLIGGFDWIDSGLDGQSTGAFPSAAKTAQQSNAYYAQMLTEITSTTQLNLGWRAQRVESERRDVPPSFSLSSQSRTDRLYANEIALKQTLGESWTAHIKSVRSFRVANADENAFTGTGDLLKPQTADEKEIGLEYRAQDFNASVSVYDIKLENEISYSPLALANINLSPTRHRGVELSAGLQLARNFHIHGSLEFIEAKFRSGEYGGVDVSGNDIPLVPKKLASVNASWEFMPHTKLSAYYRYVGAQRYDNDQANTYPSRMPSYQLVDLGFSREWRDWLFLFDVKNLFDENYYSYGYVKYCATFCAYPQAGRTAFASIEYRFR